MSDDDRRELARYQRPGGAVHRLVVGPTPLANAYGESNPDDYVIEEAKTADGWTYQDSLGRFLGPDPRGSRAEDTLPEVEKTVVRSWDMKDRGDGMEVRVFFGDGNERKINLADGDAQALAATMLAVLGSEHRPVPGRLDPDEIEVSMREADEEETEQ